MAARTTATTSRDKADSQQGGDLSGGTGVGYKSEKPDYGKIVLSSVSFLATPVVLAVAAVPGAAAAIAAGGAAAVKFGTQIADAKSASSPETHTIADAAQPNATPTTVDVLDMPLPTHQAPPPGGIVPEGTSPNPGAAAVVSGGTSKGVLWVVAVAVVLIMAIVVKDD
jgi:hypothetical protein